jgi:hypothetical protein
MRLQVFGLGAVLREWLRTLLMHVGTSQGIHLQPATHPGALLEIRAVGSCKEVGRAKRLSVLRRSECRGLKSDSDSL